MKKFFQALCVCLALTLTACGGNGDASLSSPNSSSNSGDSGNSGVCAHADTDNNGFCDACKQSLTVELDFYAVNDIHGKFLDSDSQPGVDELATYLNNAKTENPNTVLLSSGDTWQGTAESGLTKGLILTDWMNALDFVSMTLGNHEYDWGEEFIVANAEQAEFPFLACNIYSKTTNQLVEYCQPSVLVEKSGVQIGIIGAIGDCYSSIASDFTKNIYFKTGDDLTSLVKAESAKLRNQGADFIVYSLHDGYGSSSSTVRQVLDYQIASYYDIELSKGHVDLVFEGHTHQNYVLKDSQGVYHLQGGGDNDGITHTEVTVNPVSGTHKVSKAQFIRTSEYEHLSDDPVVDELIQKYETEVTKASQDLGANDVHRNSTYLRQLVADLYAKKGEALWSDYDIVLGGGYLSVRSPYELSTGRVLYSDLYTLFPFNNQLVLCSISGANLKSRFLNSTNSNYYIGLTEYGKSVQNSIVDSKTYYVVVDTYSSTYSYNRLTEIERFDQEYYARDLLAEYIQAGGLSPSSVVTEKTIAQLLELGADFAENQETEEQFLVRGEIVEISNTTYGNMTLRDENGNTLFVYGLYDQDGYYYSEMHFAPKAGDTILVKGPLKRYVNHNTGEDKLQLTQPTFVRRVVDGQSYNLTSIPDALAIAGALNANAETEEDYYVKGKIINISNEKYGNITIEDENGNTLYIYGVYDAEMVLWENMRYQPQIGDVVVLSGVLKKYVAYGKTTLEMVNGIIRS